MNFSNVVSVYEGRNGACCCGCKGAHVYREDTREAAAERRGYGVSDDEVDDARFDRILAEMVEDASHGRVECWGDDYVATVRGGRIRIAYLAS